jgi:hypothetical protein
VSINFKIKDKNSFLKIISTGSCDDLNQLKEYVLAIQNAVLSFDKTRVLVDETQLEYKLSTIDTFNSGRFISQLTPKPHKIAVICKSDGWHDAKFWETVAVNRGVSVQVFRDRDDAESWVLN